MVPRLKQNRRRWVKTLGAAQTSANRIKHRCMRITFGLMKRASTKCCSNLVNGMAEHDHHLIANRTDCIVARRNQRYRASPCGPRRDLLLAAHPPAAAGCADYANAAEITCGGH